MAAGCNLSTFSGFSPPKSMVWDFFLLLFLTGPGEPTSPQSWSEYRQARKREKKLLSKTLFLLPAETNIQQEAVSIWLAVWLCHPLCPPGQPGHTVAAARRWWCKRHFQHFRSNRRNSHKVHKLTWCPNACSSKVISVNLLNLFGFKQSC